MMIKDNIAKVVGSNLNSIRGRCTNRGKVHIENFRKKLQKYMCLKSMTTKKAGKSSRKEKWRSDQIQMKYATDKK